MESFACFSLFPACMKTGEEKMKGKDGGEETEASVVSGGRCHAVTGVFSFSSTLRLFLTLPLCCLPRLNLFLFPSLFDLLSLIFWTLLFPTVVKEGKMNH